MPLKFMVPSLKEGCYLGGMAALNLPLPGGTGDWHMWQTFFRVRKKRSRSFICGPGCLTNTDFLFGREGIYDCTLMLDKLGIFYETPPVYAANHVRATADLVIDAVLQDRSPEFVVLDDWMPNDQDKDKVFGLLTKSYPHLSKHQYMYVQSWIVKNK